jgi:hypothetical protein
VASCLQWGEQRIQSCNEYRDNGHNACSSWDAQCCDWWPCSWACKLVTWLCVGWYWVANVVCVAWTVVTTAVCLLWDVVTTVVNAVLETVESILGWLLSALAFVVDLIFSIPFVGRVLRWIWNVVLAIVWGLVGLGDAVLGLIGIRPEKKLRICVLVLRDEKGPVAQTADVVRELQTAVDIYHDQANVRLMPSAPFQYDSGFAPARTVTNDWVTVMPDPASAGMLDVDCNEAAFGEDVSTKGSEIELTSSSRCFYGNFRRLTGYGAPVVVLIVRSVKDPPGSSRLGCSLGPLSDYVTIEGSNPLCIAHELGHSCNLWHVDEAANLMNPMCGRRQLDWWQVLIVRDSRHVSYF